MTGTNPTTGRCLSCGTAIYSPNERRDGCSFGQPGVTLAWCPASRGGCGAWRPTNLPHSGLHGEYARRGDAIEIVDGLLIHTERLGPEEYGAARIVADLR